MALPNGSHLPDALAGLLGPVPHSPKWLLLVAGGTCPACQNLARSLNERQSELEQIPILVVDVGTGSEPRFEDLLHFPVRSISDERGGIKETLQVKGIPHSFVMDADQVTDQHLGDNLAAILPELAGPRATR
jgi:hypothetical protein